MTRRSIAFLLPLLLLVGAGAAQAGRQHPLTLPEPIAIPADVTPQQALRAIKVALLTRTWTISGEQPGRIEATLKLRDHTARIAIDYDAREIRFAHIDSINLMEEVKRGQRVIHRNYNSWVQNVANDLRIQLSLANI